MAAQTETRKADKIIASTALLKDIIPQEQIGNAARLLEMFHSVETELKELYAGNQGMYPKIENKPFYFFTKGNFYLVDPARYLCPNTGNMPTQVEGVSTTYLNWDQFGAIFSYHKNNPIFSRYDSNGYREIINKDGKRYIQISGYKPNYFKGFYIYNNGNNCNDNGFSCREIRDLGDYALRLPISTSIGVQNAIIYNLMPSDLTADAKKLFALLMKYQKNGWLVWENNHITRFSDDYYALLKADKIEDFEDCCLKKESIQKYIESGKAIHLAGEGYDHFVQRLVNVDQVRANLTPYEESRLTDPNGGHWDLWQTKAGENETLIQLDTAFYGRNPVADVQKDGIIGIDFGTKSTVVTFQNGTDTTAPMRIGCGDYKKDVTPEDYENPTVMEFINLERFMERYRASAGRPETEWVDMTISHTAADNLNSPQSGSEYYAWFSDLKQWASDKNRKIIIKDKQGKEIELSPFVDITDHDLNPIELYAYLLGLFINNMYNKIYVNYILSFPVTYERKIRQKIAVSFSDGLKKSLPQPVLDDENTMKLFRVMEGASEPAAYAVCALKEYGFQPKEGEKILYGIFDFGGGTTDFDFGTWQRAPKKLQRRYDYVIKHFGAGGDRLLGGENILELLAYAVFQKNEAILRQNDIQFIKPADAEKYCGSFDGSEALIADSQQAKINHRMLAEVLRPLWHGEEYTKETVKLNLYNTKDEVVTQELELDVEELKALIHKRIESGVENFFEAMKKAVTAEIAEGVDQIHIFLAGNSSKSAVVLEAFDAYQKKYQDVFAKKLNIEIKSENLDDVVSSTDYTDYLVNKYKEILPEIIEGLNAEYGVELDDSFVDDSFLLYLDGREICYLFDIITYVTGCSSNELMEDILAVWAEECIPLDAIKEMALVLNDNGITLEDECKIALCEFLYNNAAISEESKKKLETAFHPKQNQQIAETTAKILHERLEKNQILFRLYPPLGTEESDKLRKSMGIAVSSAVTRPTGKTGVAYGLLECRAGSRIKVESEIKDTDEIKFNFYTGYNNCGKFEVITDRDIEYGKWVEFIDASESDFELYYTDLPEAAENQMSIHGVRKKICRIDETMDDAMVYIRAIEPSVLEFCAAFGEDELKNQEYLSPPKKLVLE